MAKVIVDTSETVVVTPWWEKLNTPIIGLILGVVWWVATALIRLYIIEPWACRDTAMADMCVGSYDVAGNIATILMVALGVFMLVRRVQPRPIITAAATAVVVWGLGGYITGLVWYEALLWAVLAYTFAYALFGLVARINTLYISLVAAVVIAVAIRLLLLI